VDGIVNFLRALFDVVKMLVALMAGFYAIAQAMALYNRSLPGSGPGDPSYAVGSYVGSVAGLVIGSVVCFVLIWSFWWRPKWARRK
jgi:TctA family transporter